MSRVTQNFAAGRAGFHAIQVNCAVTQGSAVMHRLTDRYQFARVLIVVLVIIGLPLLTAINQPFARAPDQIPLIAATLKDNLAQVRRLLDAGANPDEHDDNRNTALIFAARDGQTQIAKALIKAGADASWIDGELVTPLILASLKNHVAIVKLLLAQGVDRNQRDKWGRTALDYAKRRGASDPIYKLLAQ